MRLVTLTIAITFALTSTMLMAPSRALAVQKAYVPPLNRYHCARLTKQINHFEYTTLELARRRGDKMWVAGTKAHLDRLKNRRADRCREWGAERTVMARVRDQAIATQKAINTAARLAVSYFTGGVYTP